MNANEPRVSEKVIGCAIAVSNELGVGFLEAVYANALVVELTRQGIRYEREKQLQVFYKQVEIGTYYADFLIEDCLLVELKALKALAPEHEAQVMNYLRAGGVTAALLLNFGTARLGVRRIVLGHDDSNFI
ncbi:MAG: GxxExxY protein [Rhodanobacteraceae bacterium]|nr:MAG: GxxExxY protein [Rhodanobacteraceae bacterium]